MGEKRKASGDAPGTSPPPARMRTASSDDEDVSHGGDTGSGGERNRVEMVPLPQPLPMAGMDANLTDNSGQIDSFGRTADEEGSLPSGNGEELAAAAGQPQTPPPPDQHDETAEAPQTLSKDERKASDEAPGSSQPHAPRREAENDEDLYPPGYLARLGYSPSDPTIQAMTGLFMLQAEMARDIPGGPRPESTDGGSSASEQEEVTSSLRPVPSSAQALPSRSEEELAAAAAAAQAQSSPPANQPADAEAQPLPSDDESVASAAAVEDSDHLGRP